MPMKDDDPFSFLKYQPPEKPAAELPKIDWASVLKPQPPAAAPILDWHSLLKPSPAPAPLPNLGSLWSGLGLSMIEMPGLFVSYQHRCDQWYYNRFSELFSGVYDLFRDTSVDREI